MNKEQIIDFIKDRIALCRTTYEDTKVRYEENMKKFNFDNAEKYHKWLMAERNTLTELEYIYDKIVERGWNDV